MSRTLSSRTAVAGFLGTMAGLLVSATIAVAGTVTVPIRLDEPFLRRLLIAQVFDRDGERAELWREPHGCGHLILERPEVDAVGTTLVVRAGGTARWATPLAKSCLLPLDWEGRVEVVEQPTLDAKLPIVHFTVVDTSVTNKDGKKTLTSRLWDWIKRYVHPSFESVTVDLHKPVEELRTLLPMVLPAAYLADADTTLASVTLADARVEEDALVIDVAFAAPEATPGEAPPEPPLDIEEVEQWDAFLTFVVKHAALDIEAPALRDALLTVLLESRYDIVQALVDAEPGARDPVPDLFRKAWTRLSPVLRDADAALPGSAAMRYLSFIAAGDALMAIDELGPTTGLDISADGLRRMARIVAPQEARDPLSYETIVDPELRDSFGFGTPLPLPVSPPHEASAEAAKIKDPTAPAVAPDIPAPTTTTSTTTMPDRGASAAQGASPPPSPPQPPTTTLPSQPPQPPTTLAPQPPTTKLRRLERSLVWRHGARSVAPLASLLAWIVTPADAAEDADEMLRERLKNWVPTRQQLDDYLPAIRTVLNAAAAETLAKKPVDASYVSIFRPLVLATAWKETCWRQFVRRSGKIVAIESNAGAIGIMQVNPRVWRGFYDVAALRTDLPYNARAGGEILQHYLVDYAIRKGEHEKGGGIDALVRATYAAYNGGPGHLSRYRSEKTAKSLRAIDAEFWRIYSAVKSGNELGVKKCFGV